jgi:hypothetical protein
MHVYARVHRWVIWWLYVGAVFGLIAAVNILTGDLTRTQERVIVVIGVLFWTLGGFVCHAYEGVKFQRSPKQLERDQSAKFRGINVTRDPSTQWR